MFNYHENVRVKLWLLDQYTLKKNKNKESDAAKWKVYTWYIAFLLFEEYNIGSRACCHLDPICKYIYIYIYILRTQAGSWLYQGCDPNNIFFCFHFFKTVRCTKVGQNRFFFNYFQFYFRFSYYVIIIYKLINS